ncbi:MAG: hypothetical protein QNK37_32895 [Acidobacteriota bacterium]|nr:hypothetical protein [Acidobacteriota bacterium]
MIRATLKGFFPLVLCLSLGYASNPFMVDGKDAPVASADKPMVILSVTVLDHQDRPLEGVLPDLVAGKGLTLEGEQLLEEGIPVYEGDRLLRGKLRNMGENPLLVVFSNGQTVKLAVGVEATVDTVEVKCVCKCKCGTQSVQFDCSTNNENCADHNGDNCLGSIATLHGCKKDWVRKTQ